MITPQIHRFASPVITYYWDRMVFFNKNESAAVIAAFGEINKVSLKVSFCSLAKSETQDKDLNKR